MAEVTVKQFADVVGVSLERLLAQLEEAGLSEKQSDDLISDDEKSRLLTHLRRAHGKDETGTEPSKVTLNRKTVTELKVPTERTRMRSRPKAGPSKTVSVEFRRKRTYVKRSVVAEEEASKVERALGNFELAIELGNRAIAADPLNPVLLRNQGLNYRGAGQHENSEKMLRRIQELYPEREGGYADISWPLANLGRFEEAIQFVRNEEKLHPTNVLSAQLSYAFLFHSLGKAEDSERSLQYVIDNASEFLAFQIAEIYAWRGEPDRAFEWLEISYEQRDGGVTHMMSDPTMKSLHDDPRWEEFLLKVGLLDAWKKNAKPHWEARQ